MKKKWIEENSERLATVPAAESWLGHDEKVAHPVELAMEMPAPEVDDKR